MAASESTRFLDGLLKDLHERLFRPAGFVRQGKRAFSRSLPQYDMRWDFRVDDQICLASVGLAFASLRHGRGWDPDDWQWAGRIDELTLNPSDVHPTNAGHQAIAGAVWKALALDMTAPTIEVAATLDATRLTPTLRFAAHDDTGVDSVSIEAGGATASGPYRTGDGEYVALIDLRGSGGSATVTIHAADAAGNVTSSAVTVNAPDRVP